MDFDVSSVSSIAEVSDMDSSSCAVIVDVRQVVVVFFRLSSSQDIVVICHSSHVVEICWVGINIPVHQPIKNLKKKILIFFIIKNFVWVHKFFGRSKIV